MMNRIRPQNHSGFTLLEILISISILAILVVILISGLQVGVKSWEKGAERISQSQSTRVIQDLIFQDIRSCHPYYISTPNKRILVFKGEKDRIDFISASTSFIAQSNDVGLREVSYYIDDDSSTDENGLVIREAMITGRDDVFSEDRGILVELDPNVTEIKFRYFVTSDSLRVPESELEEGKWLDSWDSMDTELGIIEEESDESVDNFMERINLYKQKYFPRAIEIVMKVEMKRGKSTEEVELPALIIPIKTGQHFTNPHVRR
jgi:general secretion pathway protein J